MMMMTMSWKLVGKIFITQAAFVGIMFGSYVLGGKLGEWIAEEI